MADGLDLFSTPKLIVVMHLSYKGIEPIRRTVDEKDRAVLHYIRDEKLEAVLSTHMTKCPECGIAFEGIEEAYAKAKRMLLDGDLGVKRIENREEAQDE